jgi:electron transport complex protein RnfD
MNLGRRSLDPAAPAANSVSRVMRRVIYALLPGSLLFVYFFGWGVAVNMVLAMGSAWLFEAAMLRIRSVPLAPFLGDGSALLTGLLLALSLPPLTPWWIPVLGSFVAIVVAKQVYGGLGYNPFNPAMAAFAVLLIAFPRELTLWAAPLALQAQPLDLWQAIQYSLSGALPGELGFDAISSATPLDKLRTDIGLGQTAQAVMQAPMFGHWAGLGGEWVSLGYLAGGLALIALRIISWHIPVSMLATLALAAGIGQWLDPQHGPGALLHLLAGATMLGAFFIATDPVTAATTGPGKLIYGAGIGLLVYAIRTWGGYPDGVAFAVLLMGLTVPLLDRHALPRVFGARAAGDEGAG